MTRYLYAFVLLLATGAPIYAQLTSGAQTIRLARATYEQGRLHDIEGLLVEKMQGNFFTPEEKEEAYKLLCLSYIYLEEPAKADEAMLNLLRTNHYFEIDTKNDPAEFVALYRTFRTEPIYRIGVKLGANATQPNVRSFVPANDGESKYSYGIAFQGGFALEKPLPWLKKRLTFAPELNFRLAQFLYENNASPVDLSSGESRQFTTTSTENQAWISLPLALQYKLGERGNISPFVTLGVAPEYLITARNTFLRTKEDASSLEEQTLDMRKTRSVINISAILSAGAKWKISGGFAIAEVRYYYGVTNINEKEDIYSNFDRTFPTSGFVDGIFSQNSVSVAIGYVYNIFNPKKINR